MSSSHVRKFLLTTRLVVGIVAGSAAGVTGVVAAATVQEAPALAAPGDDSGTSTLPTTRSKAVPTTPFVASPTLKAPPYGKS